MPAVYKLSELGTAELAVRADTLALAACRRRIDDGINGAGAAIGPTATLKTDTATRDTIVDHIAANGAVAEF